MRADAQRAAAEPPPQGGSPSPRAVTRGESRKAASATKVDWLNATFDRPDMTVEGFVAFLGKLFGRPTSGQEGRGLIGFQTGVKLRCYLSGEMVDVGHVAYGGEAQRGRWLLQLTGRGCGLVQDWPSMRQLLEDLSARITRLDLALDFLEGQYTVDDAVRMHSEGQFNGRGRPPSTHVAGDWLDKVRGRTLYVGKAANGKTLRVYEKGKQLGDLTSDWVRYEVQLGNRDREIPLEALTERDAFFAGCYPALASMLDEAAQTIDTKQTEGHTTLGFLLTHLKRSYGKLLHTLGAFTGATHTDLIEEVRVIGTPRRLNPSGVVAGLEWAEVQAQHRKAKL